MQVAATGAVAARMEPNEQALGPARLRQRSYSTKGDARIRMGLMLPTAAAGPRHSLCPRHDASSCRGFQAARVPQIAPLDYNARGGGEPRCRGHDLRPAVHDPGRGRHFGTVATPARGPQAGCRKGLFPGRRNLGNATDSACPVRERRSHRGLRSLGRLPDSFVASSLPLPFTIRITYSRERSIPGSSAFRPALRFQRRSPAGARRRRRCLRQRETPRRRSPRFPNQQESPRRLYFSGSPPGRKRACIRKLGPQDEQNVGVIKLYTGPEISVCASAHRSDERRRRSSVHRPHSVHKASRRPWSSDHFRPR